VVVPQFWPRWYNSTDVAADNTHPTLAIIIADYIYAVSEQNEQNVMISIIFSSMRSEKPNQIHQYILNLLLH